MNNGSHRDIELESHGSLKSIAVQLSTLMLSIEMKDGSKSGPLSPEFLIIMLSCPHFYLVGGNHEAENASVWTQLFKTYLPWTPW
jgi:hypothetical protein